MRNLKKIIAVVVTLVMLFAITSISASAAAAPVFSLRGATEVNFLEKVDNEGDPAQYYELAVYLEDASEQVGAIQGVITYEPEIFTYKDAVLGSALSSDLNSVDNSIKAQYDESKAETGTIKFVGLSDKAGEWFVIRFRITGEEKVGATFALKAYAANKEGSASLVVNTKSIASTIVDEELINMEGGAILQKTHGLSSEKHIIHGTGYKPEEGAEKKVMNATLIRPEGEFPTVGTEYTATTGSYNLVNGGQSIQFVEGKLGAFESVPLVKITRTTEAANEQLEKANPTKFGYYTLGKSNVGLCAGGTSIMFYIELPEGVDGIRMGSFWRFTGGASPYHTLANDAVHLLANDSDTWETIYNQRHEAGTDKQYYAILPTGFKGLVRIDYKVLSGSLTIDSNLFDFGINLHNMKVGSPVYISHPWLVEEFNTTDYEGWYVNTADKAEEPTQELTFDVKVDAEVLELKEAELKSKVVEVGTLFMYTKRLAYRELTLDMTDKTGLAKASRVLEDGEPLKSFTVNLKNIRWDAMGVSVSARAYIKFADGTVIYSRNYNNKFETNAGYARESVIGVALDAIDAGHYDTVLAANYGYDVNSIQSIAATALSTHKLTGEDRILLLNFIADCYKAPEVVA